MLFMRCSLIIIMIMIIAIVIYSIVLFGLQKEVIIDNYSVTTLNSFHV